MRNNSALVIAAAMVFPVLLTGCGSEDAAPPAQQGQAARPEAPAQATVSLSGCVEASGAKGWRLRNVRFEPRQAGDPHRETTTSGAHGITEGSWVQLAGDQDLTSHAGQRVKVTGVIADDGRNTIGTAGTPGVVTPTGDTSQAASKEHHSDKVKTEAGRIARESMADGTAASVRVQQVQGTGESCADARRPDTKR